MTKDDTTMGKATASKAVKTGPSNARARTAHQLARQERAFHMSIIDGMSSREIALELKVDRKTVDADLRAESERRAEEFADRRAVEIARSISFYQRVAARALKRAEMSDEILAQIRDGDNDCEKKVNDRSFEAAIKAQERIDKLLGLEAATKIDLGVTGELLEAFNDFPKD